MMLSLEEEAHVILIESCLSVFPFTHVLFLLKVHCLLGGHKDVLFLCQALLEGDPLGPPASSGALYDAQ